MTLYCPPTPDPGSKPTCGAVFTARSHGRLPRWPLGLLEPPWPPLCAETPPSRPQETQGTSQLGSPQSLQLGKLGPGMEVRNKSHTWANPEKSSPLPRGNLALTKDKGEKRPGVQRSQAKPKFDLAPRDKVRSGLFPQNHAEPLPQE